MRFIDHKQAKYKIPDGVYLIRWMVDTVESRRVLKLFHDQVMMNKNRKAVYVKKGGMVSLFVNNMTKRF